MLDNAPQNYGPLAIIIHWLVAIAIVGLFVLGVWMVGLDYYSSWYQVGPNIHRSVGLLLLLVLAVRLVWGFTSSPPAPEPGIKQWERRSAVGMHWLLNLLTLLIIASGYLISTADGRGVSVFGWFEIPATVTSIDQQEEIAGKLHYYLAVLILVFASLHALAAFKHHFIERDATLKKMLGINK